MDFSRIDANIRALEERLTSTAEVSPTEPLLVGVDLGTACIVVVVLNAARQPVACALRDARVVKDGLVVDYIGAMRIVRELVTQLEERLGRRLENAAIAVPPGTGERDCSTHQHVVEGVGLNVVAVLDEPSAANAVLHVQDGVIVDVGGGTTGLAFIENGKVTFTADEPTGGTHLSLVLAGGYGISVEEAESLKRDTSRHAEILPVVRPVVQKIASIIRQYIAERDVPAIYLVGGTCCLTGIEQIIAKETGKYVCKPANPLLVTPLGIALHCDENGVNHG